MGNIFTKVLYSLKMAVIHRREDEYGIHRSRPDHPERLQPDQVKPLIDDKQKTTLTQSDPIIDSKQTETSTKQIPVINQVAPLIKCSDFYLACRNNKLEEVKKLLETISQDEIDQVEPNGSTALHAASYHGHADIVKLLLERGADRAIRNKFRCLPFDEASTDEIKELFLRIPNSNRLILNTGSIEWELIDDDVLEKAMEERKIITTIYNTIPIDKMFDKIEKNYIDKGLTTIKKIVTIKHFFEKATKEKDPKWIIKAYTAETDFYNVLNAEIACGASKYQSERRYLIALLSHHPSFDSLTFIGTSYRVMEINDDDLEKYQIDNLSMTKSFLSSSIDEKIAAWFLCRQESETKNGGRRHNRGGKLIKSWVMCRYQIRHSRTALHIENSSQYAAEGEILIMPYTVFKVKTTKTYTPSYLPDGQKITEIEFEECDQYIETD
jgi:hypothetical protein